MAADATLSSMSRSSDEAIVRGIQQLTRRVTAVGRRHPVATDCMSAIALAAASLVGLALQGRLDRADTIVFCLALCAPLPLRGLDRRLSFALVAVVALVQWLTSTPQIADAAVLIALFWVALDGSALEMAGAALAVEAGAVMAALHWSPGRLAQGLDRGQRPRRRRGRAGPDDPRTPRAGRLVGRTRRPPGARA